MVIYNKKTLQHINVTFHRGNPKEKSQTLRLVSTEASQQDLSRSHSLYGRCSDLP